MPDTPSSDPHATYPAKHSDDVQRLLALAPQDRPQWLQDLIGGDTPTADNTPATPVHGDSTEPAGNHPDDVRRLLALPADQRPYWLNEFLGDMTIPTIPADSTNPLLDIVMANTAHGEKNATLVFPLDQVLAAAEHAATAPAHKRGYGETDAAPRLWWVKDGGTYLMSNGQDPADTRDKHDRPTTVVYADGWGPDTDPRSILGGDDFRESIDLTRPLDGSTRTLLDILRAAAADGATRFTMNAVFDDHHMTLTYTTE
ncbi:DUF3085 domain-containing protein [Streptomyces bungoensis]|uniref:DUF3085 domain-containing protein n=1 Tax=Streptomyces bungoensis TaxID=285568 RepID=UPI0033E8387F